MEIFRKRKRNLPIYFNQNGLLFQETDSAQSLLTKLISQQGG
jgi:hypothetical protein